MTWELGDTKQHTVAKRKFSGLRSLWQILCTVWQYSMADRIDLTSTAASLGGVRENNWIVMPNLLAVVPLSAFGLLNDAVKQFTTRT